MKILLVANTLPPTDLSGAGEQVVQLASGLRELGHEVHVLGRGRGGARGPKVLFPLTILWPLRKQLRALEPDVVQLHESDGGLAALLFRLLRPRGSAARLVALQQVSYVEERRAVRPLRDGPTGKVLARPVKAELWFRRLRTPLQILLGRWTARRSQLVFAPSRQTAKELERDYGAQTVELLPNATGALTPMGTSRLPDATTMVVAEGFVFVGRFRIRKGIEVLLAAFERFAGGLEGAGAPGARPRLLLVGAGERSESVRLAMEEVSVEGAQLLGRLDREATREVVAHARALVVPSTYEGMPLVILEAMELGVPIIASRVSGIPEVVIDGETGWIVPPEDVEALAGALREAWLAPEVALERGLAGRGRLGRLYRPRTVAEQWISAVRTRFEDLEPAPRS